MKELELYEGVSYDIITLNEPTRIVCNGHVKAKKIACTKQMEVIITGDALTVENPDHGIAIGADADWGLSYGRFTLPNFLVSFKIDVKEIHCHSKTPNCGIGTFGVRAIQENHFTDNCVIRDTPIGMQIYVEPLYGTTKHSVLPRYMSNDEYKLMEDKRQQELNKKLFFDKTIGSLVVTFSSEMIGFKQELPSRKDLYVKAYKSVKSFIQRLDRSNYGEGVLRLFASFAKAMYDVNAYMPAQFRHMAGDVAYLCLAQELKLFDKVATLPLALRFYLVIYDMTENNTLEKYQLENVSSFTELSLDENLVEWYNLPRDLNFSDECTRYFFGESVFQEDNREIHNTLISPKLIDKDYVLSSKNVLLAPRLRWCYTAISYNYRDSLGDFGAIILDKEHKRLELKIISKDNVEQPLKDAILVGYDNVVTDVFSLLKEAVRD